MPKLKACGRLGDAPQDVLDGSRGAAATAIWVIALIRIITAISVVASIVIVIVAIHTIAVSVRNDAQLLANLHPLRSQAIVMEEPLSDAIHTPAQIKHPLRLACAAIHITPVVKAIFKVFGGIVKIIGDLVEIIFAVCPIYAAAVERAIKIIFEPVAQFLETVNAIAQVTVAVAPVIVITTIVSVTPVIRTAIRIVAALRCGQRWQAQSKERGRHDGQKNRTSISHLLLISSQDVGVGSPFSTLHP